MRLWRSLTLRILGASLLASAVGVVTVTLMFIEQVETRVARALDPLIDLTYSAYERPRCELSPETWSIIAPNAISVFAYDSATGISRNPAAPPLDASAVARLSANPGEHVAFDLPGPLWTSGTFAYAATQGGPCGLIQATIPRDLVPALFNAQHFVAFIFILTIVTALGFVFVICPLIARIRSLSASAERVGERDAYTPAFRELEDFHELGQVSSGLDRAHARMLADGDRLEERRQALEEHLGNIAHDLRTPITSLHLALEQAATMARAPALAEVLSGALADAVYLAGLTSNLRLATQLEEAWDPCPSGVRSNLVEIVERVGARGRMLARHRGIELELATPEPAMFVRCNPVALEQAVCNLVENALQYNLRGGHVAIVLEVEARGHFSLTISDDGPNSPPKDLAQLFERSFRTDEARRRRPEGHGLGLAIAHEICRRCGWTLSMQARAPRGLEAIITGTLIEIEAEIARAS